MTLPEGALGAPSSGDHPWVAAEYSFAGWVPNVSGHLSFNQVDPKGRESTYNHQAALAEPRTVVAHRRRLAQDYPWWNWVVGLLRPQASQDFLLLAESGAATTPYIRDGALQEVADDQGALYGVLLVLPHDDVPASEKKRRGLLQEIDVHISAALTRRADDAIPQGERLAVDVMRKVDAVRADVAAYAMRFTLFRTGECRIWFDLGEFLGRDLASRPATADELITAGKLPAQAYYFVKDLLHAHYHHDPSSDQILPLTRLTGGATPALFKRDEEKWRYVSLRGLVRVVVELRQGRSLQGHKQALGIIAYANAFQTVLARAIRTRGGAMVFDDTDRLVTYEFDSLTKSIEATDFSMESVTTSRLQLFAIEVGILFSALALWAGAVQIQPILCASKEISCDKVGPGPVVDFVNVVVANPLGFTVSLLTVGFLFFVMFFRGTGSIPYAERFVRFVKGLADAVGAQIARWTRGFDLLSWLLSLVLLATLVWYSAKLAYWLVPKTHVPSVVVQRQSPPAGPWSGLQGYVGKPVGASGLLTTSLIAQDLRNLLGSDYYAHVRTFEGAALKREGNIFYATSRPRPGGDGGYLILDAASQRIEAALRENGRFHPHRSPGPELRMPVEVRSLLGSSAGLDADPVPVEGPRCSSLQGGVNGNTIQFRGAMQPNAYCTYTIPLQTGQRLSFNYAASRGLSVTIVSDGKESELDPDYVAPRAGRFVVRVAWSGWNPSSRQVVKARRFFVRLNIR